jgi:uncharacterized coiled-coil protein SlyX
MSTWDLSAFSKTEQSIKNINDQEFLSRLLEKIQGFSDNKKVFNDQKKHSLSNHFELGGMRDLSRHILARNSWPRFTSSTSIHAPLLTPSHEHQKSVKEIKQRLIKASWVDKVINPNIIKNEKDEKPKTPETIKDLSRSKSAQQTRKKVQKMNKKLKSLYGTLKRTTMQTQFAQSAKKEPRNASKPTKSNPRKVKKKSIFYTSTENSKNSDSEVNSEYLQFRKETVSYRSNILGGDTEEVANKQC